MYTNLVQTEHDKSHLQQLVTSWVEIFCIDKCMDIMQYYRLYSIRAFSSGQHVDKGSYIYSHYQKFKTTLNFKTKLTKLNSKLHKSWFILNFLFSHKIHIVIVLSMLYPPNLQYFEPKVSILWIPLFFITSCRRCGILCTRFLQNSWEISFTHTLLITFTRSLALDGCFSATLFFILVYRFWIGLRSGLLPSQSRTLIWFSARKVLATFNWWQGAPSCMKILQLCTAIWIFSFSASNST